ncbi:MAG: hypothetical protein KDJ38_15375 [Gammaproteobacteria bacterium]|nr:hypothetical protein [Gammaproteobacteria bacterium]
MFQRKRWMQAWFARRMKHKVERVSRHLALNETQHADLEAMVKALAETRQALWLSQQRVGLEIADILRNTDLKAVVLRAEISESLDEVKQQVDEISHRLVTLVEHLDDAQRTRLAGLIERRLCLHPAH